MNLSFTSRFQKQLQRLVKRDPKLTRQVEKTLQYLRAFPPAHPSLRMKRIQGTDAVYECSVNMTVRITFAFGENDAIVLRNIDLHDDALKAY